jgi:hypothetical protein
MGLYIRDLTPVALPVQHVLNARKLPCNGYFASQATQSSGPAEGISSAATVARPRSAAAERRAFLTIWNELVRRGRADQKMAA